jgi:hypothetical protein
VRLTKFGFPSRVVPQQDSRVSIFEPTLGFDGGQAPQELHPGFTPESKNFIHEAGYIQPRSGMSRYDASYAMGGSPQLGMELFDVNANRHALAVSSQTVAYLPTAGVQFSNLSWVAAAGASDQTLAGQMNDAPNGALIYEPARDKNIAVFTNGRQLPKFLNVESGTTTYSDFTWVASSFSKARAVCESDYRLVWGNVSSSTLSYPVRVQWSVRGNPLDLSVSNGGGFEDLMDMRGEIVRVVPDGDGIVLFTGEQIWRGRKRMDAYAFDFDCVQHTLGCPYPRTIHSTPNGIVFLGRDLELYVLRGDQAIPLGPTGRKGPEQGDHSRVQAYLQRVVQNSDLAWACYNSKNNRSEFYYTSNETNANLHPQNRLTYHWANQSFFKSTTSLDWACGFEMQDTEEAVTWDSIPYTWEQYDVSWDNAGLGPAERRVVTFSSAGTPYRFRSDQTSDDGTAIDCRWRSHGLSGQDAFRFDQIYEVWLEHESGTTSNVSVWTSNDLGRTFTDSFARALSATSHKAEMFPVWLSAQAPCFEVRTVDGSVPKISRMQVRMRDAGLYGGSL